MPLEGDNSLFVGAEIPVDSFVNGSIVDGFPAEPRIVRGVVLHIKSLDDGGSVD